jgi:hypothetical protein
MVLMFNEKQVREMLDEAREDELRELLKYYNKDKFKEITTFPFIKNYCKKRLSQLNGTKEKGELK